MTTTIAADAIVAGPLTIAGNAIVAGALSPVRMEDLADDRTRIWWAVLAERRRAEAKFGVQRLPLGTGTPEDRAMAERERATCDLLHANDALTHRAIVGEEVFEAFAEEDPAAFVVEAIQAMGTLLDAIESALEQNPDLTIPPPF